MNMASTRDHSLKVVKTRRCLDIRKFSFAHRIVNIWNGLDESIIVCDSINGFKNRIDKCLHGWGFIWAFYKASFPLYIINENASSNLPAV